MSRKSRPLSRPFAGAAVESSPAAADSFPKLFHEALLTLRRMRFLLGLVKETGAAFLSGGIPPWR